MSRGTTFCPGDVGVILSYFCANGCRHCLYNCGPEWERTPMSHETLRAALEAVTVWPGPPQVHLTGGEPFLHFDLLLDGAGMARELGLASYVETSGTWCRDYDLGVRRFTALRDAGLAAVLVSCSPFHAERTAPVRTLAAVHAAIDVFGQERVMVYLPEFVPIVTRYSLERPTPLERYQEDLGREGAGRLFWDTFGLISGGRSGYQLGQLAARRPAEAFTGQHCGVEVALAAHSHLDLYGNFISGFCGGLASGNWHELPAVLDALRSGRYPPLLGLLIERGPYGLMQLAQSEHGYEALADGYVGKCHLCVDVRRHLAASTGYAELRPRAFYDNF